MKINEYVYTELCYFYDQVLAINRVIQANHSEVCAPVNLYITLVWLFVNLVNLNITQISINNALLAYLKLTLNDGNGNTYGCFEKGCLTKGEKLTRQCRKLLWVIVVFTVAWVNLKVFQRGGRKQHKHVFVLSLSLLLNHLEPQSSKAKLVLPRMPISIVAYAFTLLWGPDFFRKSCIHKQ